MENLALIAFLDVKESIRARWFVVYTLVFGGLIALFFIAGVTESQVMGFSGLSRLLLMYTQVTIVILPIFILIRLAIFTKFRLYLVHWRYFSLKDFANTVIAAFVGTFILSFIVLAPWGTNLLGIFPRSALLGEFFLS